MISSVLMVCERCGDTVERRGHFQRYCLACSGLAKWEARVRYRRKLRRMALEAYGARCACCGIDQYEFLTFDHVNGGGTEHRRELSNGGAVALVQWIITNHFPATIQVLCYNCNQARSAHGTCPHVGEVPRE